MELRKDNLKTLNDFQKLLGDINWIRWYLKLPNYVYVLKPLNSPWVLTEESRKALQQVEERFQNTFLKRINESKPVVLCVFPTFSQPSAVLCQEGPLLWIYPRVSPTKSIEHYITAVAQLALTGIQQCLQFFGLSPERIIVPYSSH